MEVPYHLRRVGPTPNVRGVARNIHFPRNVTTIGRNREMADYQIGSHVKHQHACLSRVHARVVKSRGNTYKLIDNNSVNGVYVNNIKINGSVILVEGDMVTFGHPNGRGLVPGTRARQPESHHQFLFEQCDCPDRPMPPANPHQLALQLAMPQLVQASQASLAIVTYNSTMPPPPHMNMAGEAAHLSLSPPVLHPMITGPPGAPQQPLVPEVPQVVVSTGAGQSTQASSTIQAPHASGFPKRHSVPVSMSTTTRLSSSVTRPPAAEGPHSFGQQATAALGAPSLRQTAAHAAIALPLVPVPNPLNVSAAIVRTSDPSAAEEHPVSVEEATEQPTIAASTDRIEPTMPTSSTVRLPSASTVKPNVPSSPVSSSVAELISQPEASDVQAITTLPTAPPPSDMVKATASQAADMCVMSDIAIVNEVPPVQITRVTGESFTEHDVKVTSPVPIECQSKPQLQNDPQTEGLDEPSRITGSTDLDSHMSKCEQTPADDGQNIQGDQPEADVVVVTPHTESKDISESCHLTKDENKEPYNEPSFAKDSVIVTSEDLPTARVVPSVTDTPYSMITKDIVSVSDENQETVNSTATAISGEILMPSVTHTSDTVGVEKTAVTENARVIEDTEEAHSEGDNEEREPNLLIPTTHTVTSHTESDVKESVEKDHPRVPVTTSEEVETPHLSNKPTEDEGMGMTISSVQSSGDFSDMNRPVPYKEENVIVDESERRNKEDLSVFEASHNEELCIINTRVTEQSPGEELTCEEPSSPESQNGGVEHKECRSSPRKGAVDAKPPTTKFVGQETCHTQPEPHEEQHDPLEPENVNNKQTPTSWSESVPTKGLTDSPSVEAQNFLQEDNIPHLIHQNDNIPVQPGNSVDLYHNDDRPADISIQKSKHACDIPSSVDESSFSKEKDMLVIDPMDIGSKDNMDAPGHIDRVNEEQPVQEDRTSAEPPTVSTVHDAASPGASAADITSHAQTESCKAPGPECEECEESLLRSSFQPVPQTDTLEQNGPQSEAGKDLSSALPSGQKMMDTALEVGQTHEVCEVMEEKEEDIEFRQGGVIKSTVSRYFTMKENVQDPSCIEVSDEVNVASTHGANEDLHASVDVALSSCPDMGTQPFVASESQPFTLENNNTSGSEYVDAAIPVDVSQPAENTKSPKCPLSRLHSFDSPNVDSQGTLTSSYASFSDDDNLPADKDSDTASTGDYSTCDSQAAAGGDNESTAESQGFSEPIPAFKSRSSTEEPNDNKSTDGTDMEYCTHHGFSDSDRTPSSVSADEEPHVIKSSLSDGASTAESHELSEHDEAEKNSQLDETKDFDTNDGDVPLFCASPDGKMTTNRPMSETEEKRDVPDREQGPTGEFQNYTELDEHTGNTTLTELSTETKAPEQETEERNNITIEGDENDTDVEQDMENDDGISTIESEGSPDDEIFSRSDSVEYPLPEADEGVVKSDADSVSDTECQKTLVESPGKKRSESPVIILNLSPPPVEEEEESTPAPGDPLKEIAVDPMDSNKCVAAVHGEEVLTGHSLRKEIIPKATTDEEQEGEVDIVDSCEKTVPTEGAKVYTKEETYIKGDVTAGETEERLLLLTDVGSLAIPGKESAGSIGVNTEGQFCASQKKTVQSPLSSKLTDATESEVSKEPMAYDGEEPILAEETEQTCEDVEQGEEACIATPPTVAPITRPLVESTEINQTVCNSTRIMSSDDHVEDPSTFRTAGAICVEKDTSSKEQKSDLIEEEMTRPKESSFNDEALNSNVENDPAAPSPLPIDEIQESIDLASFETGPNSNKEENAHDTIEIEMDVVIAEMRANQGEDVSAEDTVPSTAAMPLDLGETTIEEVVLTKSIEASSNNKAPDGNIQSDPTAPPPTLENRVLDGIDSTGTQTRPDSTNETLQDTTAIEIELDVGIAEIKADQGEVASAEPSVPSTSAKPIDLFETTPEEVVQSKTKEASFNNKTPAHNLKNDPAAPTPWPIDGSPDSNDLTSTGSRRSSNKVEDVQNTIEIDLGVGIADMTPDQSGDASTEPAGSSIPAMSDLVDTTPEEVCKPSKDITREGNSAASKLQDEEMPVSPTPFEAMSDIPGTIVSSQPTVVGPTEEESHQKSNRLSPDDTQPVKLHTPDAECNIMVSNPSSPVTSDPVEGQALNEEMFEMEKVEEVTLNSSKPQVCHEEAHATGKPDKRETPLPLPEVASENSISVLHEASSNAGDAISDEEKCLIENSSSLGTDVWENPCLLEIKDSIEMETLLESKLLSPSNADTEQHVSDYTTNICSPEESASAEKPVTIGDKREIIPEDDGQLKDVAEENEVPVLSDFMKYTAINESESTEVDQGHKVGDGKPTVSPTSAHQDPKEEEEVSGPPAHDEIETSNQEGLEIMTTDPCSEEGRQQGPADVDDIPQPCELDDQEEEISELQAHDNTQRLLESASAILTQEDKQDSPQTFGSDPAVEDVPQLSVLDSLHEDQKEEEISELPAHEKIETSTQESSGIMTTDPCSEVVRQEISDDVSDIPLLFEPDDQKEEEVSEPPAQDEIKSSMQDGLEIMTTHPYSEVVRQGVSVDIDDMPQPCEPDVHKEEEINDLETHDNTQLLPESACVPPTQEDPQATPQTFKSDPAVEDAPQLSVLDSVREDQMEEEKVAEPPTHDEIETSTQEGLVMMTTDPYSKVVRQGVSANSRDMPQPFETDGQKEEEVSKPPAHDEIETSTQEGPGIMTTDPYSEVVRQGVSADFSNMPQLCEPDNQKEEEIFEPPAQDSTQRLPESAHTLSTQEDIQDTPETFKSGFAADVPQLSVLDALVLSKDVTQPSGSDIDMTLHKDIQDVQQISESDSGVPMTEALKDVGQEVQLPKLNLAVSIQEDVQDAPQPSDSGNVEDIPQSSDSKDVQDMPQPPESEDVQDKPQLSESEDVQVMPQLSECEDVQGTPQPSEFQGTPQPSEFQDVQDMPQVSESEDVQVMPHLSESANVQDTSQPSESANVQDTPQPTESEDVQVMLQLSECEDVQGTPQPSESQDVQDMPQLSESEDVRVISLLSESANVQDTPQPSESEDGPDTPQPSESEDVQVMPQLSEREDVKGTPQPSESQDVQGMPELFKTEDVQDMLQLSESEGIQDKPQPSESQDVQDKSQLSESKDVQDVPLPSDSDDMPMLPKFDSAVPAQEDFHDGPWQSDPNPSVPTPGDIKLQQLESITVNCIREGGEQDMSHPCKNDSNVPICEDIQCALLTSVPDPGVPTKDIEEVLAPSKSASPTQECTQDLSVQSHSGAPTCEDLPKSSHFESKAVQDVSLTSESGPGVPIHEDVQNVPQAPDSDSGEENQKKVADYSSENKEQIVTNTSEEKESYTDISIETSQILTESHVKNEDIPLTRCEVESRTADVLGEVLEEDIPVAEVNTTTAEVKIPSISELEAPTEPLQKPSVESPALPPELEEQAYVLSGDQKNEFENDDSSSLLPIVSRTAHCESSLQPQVGLLITTEVNKAHLDQSLEEKPHEENEVAEDNAEPCYLTLQHEQFLATGTESGSPRGEDNMPNAEPETAVTSETSAKQSGICKEGTQVSSISVKRSETVPTISEDIIEGPEVLYGTGDKDSQQMHQHADRRQSIFETQANSDFPEKAKKEEMHYGAPEDLSESIEVVALMAAEKIHTEPKGKDVGSVDEVTESSSIPRSPIKVYFQTADETNISEITDRGVNQVADDTPLVLTKTEGDRHEDSTTITNICSPAHEESRDTSLTTSPVEEPTASLKCVQLLESTQTESLDDSPELSQSEFSTEENEPDVASAKLNSAVLTVGLVDYSDSDDASSASSQPGENRLPDYEIVNHTEDIEPNDNENQTVKNSSEPAMPSNHEAEKEEPLITNTDEAAKSEDELRSKEDSDDQGSKPTEQLDSVVEPNHHVPENVNSEEIYTTEVNAVEFVKDENEIETAPGLMPTEHQKVKEAAVREETTETSISCTPRSPEKFIPETLEENLPPLLVVNPITKPLAKSPVDNAHIESSSTDASIVDSREINAKSFEGDSCKLESENSTSLVADVSVVSALLPSTTPKRKSPLSSDGNLSSKKKRTTQQGPSPVSPAVSSAGVKRKMSDVMTLPMVSPLGPHSTTPGNGRGLKPGSCHRRTPSTNTPGSICNTSPGRMMQPLRPQSYRNDTSGNVVPSKKLRLDSGVHCTIMTSRRKSSEESIEDGQFDDVESDEEQDEGTLVAASYSQPTQPTKILGSVPEEPDTMEVEAPGVASAEIDQLSTQADTPTVPIENGEKDKPEEASTTGISELVPTEIPPVVRESPAEVSSSFLTTGVDKLKHPTKAIPVGTEESDRLSPNAQKLVHSGIKSIGEPFEDMRGMSADGESDVNVIGEQMSGLSAVVVSQPQVFLRQEKVMQSQDDVCDKQENLASEQSSEPVSTEDHLVETPAPMAPASSMITEENIEEGKTSESSVTVINSATIMVSLVQQQLPREASLSAKEEPSLLEENFDGLLTVETNEKVCNEVEDIKMSIAAEEVCIPPPNEDSQIQESAQAVQIAQIIQGSSEKQDWSIALSPQQVVSTAFTVPTEENSEIHLLSIEETQVSQLSEYPPIEEATYALSEEKEESESQVSPDSAVPAKVEQITEDSAEISINKTPIQESAVDPAPTEKERESVPNTDLSMEGSEEDQSCEKYQEVTATSESPVRDECETSDVQINDGATGMMQEEENIATPVFIQDRQQSSYETHVVCIKESLEECDPGKEQITTSTGVSTHAFESCVSSKKTETTNELVGLAAEDDIVLSQNISLKPAIDNACPGEERKEASIHDLASAHDIDMPQESPSIIKDGTIVEEISIDKEGTIEHCSDDNSDNDSFSLDDDASTEGRESRLEEISSDSEDSRDQMESIQNDDDTLTDTEEVYAGVRLEGDLNVQEDCHIFPLNPEVAVSSVLLSSTDCNEIKKSSGISCATTENEEATVKTAGPLSSQDMAILQDEESTVPTCTQKEAIEMESGLLSPAPSESQHDINCENDVNATGAEIKFCHYEETVIEVHAAESEEIECVPSVTALPVTDSTLSESVPVCTEYCQPKIIPTHNDDDIRSLDSEIIEPQLHTNESCHNSSQLEESNKYDKKTPGSEIGFGQSVETVLEVCATESAEMELPPQLNVTVGEYCVLSVSAPEHTENGKAETILTGIADNVQIVDLNNESMPESYQAVYEVEVEAELDFPSQDGQQSSLPVQPTEASKSAQGEINLDRASGDGPLEPVKEDAIRQLAVWAANDAFNSAPTAESEQQYQHVVEISPAPDLLTQPQQCLPSDEQTTGHFSTGAHACGDLDGEMVADSQSEVDSMGVIPLPHTTQSASPVHSTQNHPLHSPKEQDNEGYPPPPMLERMFDDDESDFSQRVNIDMNALESDLSDGSEIFPASQKPSLPKVSGTKRTFVSDSDSDGDFEPSQMVFRSPTKHTRTSKRPSSQKKGAPKKELRRQAVETTVCGETDQRDAQLEASASGSARASRRDMILNRLRRKRQWKREPPEVDVQPSQVDPTPSITLTDDEVVSPVHRRFRKASITNDRSEEFVERAASIIDTAQSILQSNFKLSSSQRVNAWQDELKQLREKAKLPETVIAVVGDTGSGKSSVMNALISHASVLPTSGMRACTAVVVEVKDNADSCFYEGEIEFLDSEEWYMELEKLLKALKGADGSVRASRPDPNSESIVPWTKVRAVYGHFEDGVTMETLPAMGRVTNMLGRTKKVKETDPSRFRAKIDTFIESTTGHKGGQFWPIVKKVSLRIPNCLVCSSGATLVDLPGIRDSNAARDRIAKDYLRSCSAVWVVASIHRAVDDKTAKELLGEHFRRQLLMDGQYGSVSFVCTKTDIHSRSELIRGLELEDQVRPTEETIKSLQAERAILHEEQEDHQEQRSQLKKHIYAAEQDKIELESDLAELRLLGDMEEGMDSEELEERTKAEEDIAEKESEIRSLTERYQDYRRKIESNKNKINELDNLIASKQKDISFKCVQGRNEFAKSEIKRDFKAGLREMKRQAGMIGTVSDDEDEFDTESEEDEDINRTTENLKVFCVSSTEYLKLRKLLPSNDGPAQVFQTVEQTGIPDLEKHVHAMTEVSRHHGIRQLIKSVYHGVLNVESYLMDEGTKSAKTRGTAQSHIVSQINLFRLKHLSDVHRESMMAIQQTFESSLKRKINEGKKTAIERADATVAKWGSSVRRDNRKEGGLHHSTYKAVCRNNGVLISKAAGNIDLNEELADPVYTSISIVWDQVFHRMLVMHLENFQKYVLAKLETFIRELHYALRSIGVESDRLQRTEQYLKQRVDHTVTVAVGEMRGFIEDRQRNITRVVTPKVQERMKPAYAACYGESGPGTFARMKEHMRRHVSEGKEDFFDESSNRMVDLLVELQEQISRLLQVIIDRVVGDCEQVLEPYWQEPDNTTAFREAFLQGIHDCQKSVKDLASDAGVCLPLLPQPTSQSSASCTAPVSPVKERPKDLLECGCWAAISSTSNKLEIVNISGECPMHFAQGSHVDPVGPTPSQALAPFQYVKREGRKQKTNQKDNRTTMSNRPALADIHNSGQAPSHTHARDDTTENSGPLTVSRKRSLTENVPIGEEAHSRIRLGQMSAISDRSHVKQEPGSPSSKRVRTLDCGVIDLTVSSDKEDSRPVCSSRRKKRNFLQ